jgi:group II intron reverse transcriptase/maturase
MSRPRKKDVRCAQGSLFPEPSAAEAQSKEGSTEGLMERVTSPEVVSQALSRVKANHGSPGIDGMTVEALDEHWRLHGEKICQVLVAGDYIPRPVRRHRIPKPGGGERELGIPTAQDRVVQQMLKIALEPLFEPHFSQESYGFRPGRSVHDAMARAAEHVSAGGEWVVDMDLERFFDRVNHDILMSKLAKVITDKRVLKLVRRFLNAGVMDGGVAIRVHEGTPQGGPLSPLLANIMLDGLDKELERRGSRFVRYADDCNVYFGSERAALRAMEWMTRFLEVRLRLKVNASKSAVARASERQFPGFWVA